MSEAKQREEISEGERDFVSKLLSANGDQCSLMEWVTKIRRDKIQPRLIVVGKYRIYSIKRSYSGKKTVQREGHLLDLCLVKLSDAQNLILEWDDFDIRIRSPVSVQIVTRVRNNFLALSPDFPPTACPKFDLYDAHVIPDPEPVAYDVAGGWVDVYAAECNHMRLAPNQPAVGYVRDLGREGVTTLDLGQCPGIDPKSTMPLALEPVARAMRHNTYFDALVLRDVIRRDAPETLATLFAYNTTLRVFKLVNTGALGKTFGPLSDAMAVNENPACEVFDLHSNKLGDDGAALLAEGLRLYQGGITALDVSSNGIGFKGVTSIMEAVAANDVVSDSLVYLHLGGCSVTRTGGDALCLWFDRFALKRTSNPPVLRKLCLADTNLDVSVLSALARGEGISNSLEYLDLSSNNLSTAGSVLETLARECKRLVTLNLCHTKLVADDVTRLIRALGNNEALTSVDVDVSNNVIGDNGAKALASALVDNRNIRCLNVCNMRIKTEGMSSLLDSLRTSAVLDELNIGGNLRQKGKRKGKEMRALVDLLQDLSLFVSNHPSLRVLRIQGAERRYLGELLEPFLRVFGSNGRIEILDLANNRMGDSSLSTLSEALRTNTTLHTLFWDGNETTITGWQAFARCFRDNSTLSNMGYPTTDVKRFLRSQGKRSDRLKDRVDQLMGEVAAALKANLAANPHTAYSVPAFLEDGDTYGTQQTGAFRQAQTYGAYDNAYGSLSPRGSERGSEGYGDNVDPAYGQAYGQSGGNGGNGGGAGGGGAGGGYDQAPPPPSLSPPPPLTTPPPMSSSDALPPPPPLSTPPPAAYQAPYDPGYAPPYDPAYDQAYEPPYDPGYDDGYEPPYDPAYDDLAPPPPPPPPM